MKKYIYYYKKQAQPLEVDIAEISDWEGFEKLIMFVEKYYDASVIDRADGPDARRWILECRGHQFELIHLDGYGNYFLAPIEASESIVNMIAQDIDQRCRDAENNWSE